MPDQTAAARISPDTPSPGGLRAIGAVLAGVAATPPAAVTRPAPASPSPRQALVSTPSPSASPPSRPAHPTLDEPLPTLAGTPGLRLLRSSPARALAEADLDADQRAQLHATCRAIVAACQPATLADIATTLERLSLHYPQLRRTDAEARLHVRDWAEDFADYPADLIAEAARLWRNSTAERYPTPGQLKALVAGVWKHRRRLGERAEGWLGVERAQDSEAATAPGARKAELRRASAR